MTATVASLHVGAKNFQNSSENARGAQLSHHASIVGNLLVYLHGIDESLPAFAETLIEIFYQAGDKYVRSFVSQLASGFPDALAWHTRQLIAHARTMIRVFC